MSDHDHTISVTRILGEPEVKRITNLDRSTRFRMERQGRFPRRLRISSNRIGWREDEIAAWIESRPRGMVNCG